MEFTGRIAKVFPVQSGTSKNGNEYRKQEFIFEYFERPTDRWSDKVLLSVMNDKIETYNLQEGEDGVTIGFGHNVDEYQGRNYNRVNMYKFERKAHTESTEIHRNSDAGETPAVQGENDTLPF